MACQKVGLDPSIVFIKYFVSYSPLKVRVRFTNRNDGSLEEDHTVASVVSHPDFKAGRLLHNIATMVLDEPIDLVKEEGVNAACMPACNEMFVHTFKNHTGLFSSQHCIAHS